MPAEFHFLRPAWLLLLPLLLGLVPLMCRARAPGGAWRRVIDPGLLPHLLEAGSPRRRCLPAALLGLLWALLVVALAGQTWEREPTPLLEARQFHVVLLDLSPSMNAPDLAPSRLARARFEVLDLLRIADEGQTALVAFGAEPYLVAPLTGDADTIALQVPLLETALLPVAGERRTDLALALAGELLDGASAPSGSVVLVADGLSPRAGTLAAAERLRAAGHRVHVLGVGTAAGAPLADADGRLLRGPDGAVRLARLDEDGLRALALAGGGLYRTAVAGDGDVQALVAAASRDRAEGDDDAVERWRDLGPWLVLAALPLALLGFRRGWLGPLVLALAVLPPQPARAGAWDDLWLTPDQQGARALEDGRADAAQGLFERPDWRAAAAHAAADYAAALQALEGLPPAQSAYNRGNLLARLGDYQAAIEAYETALAADPQDRDARHNLDLLRELLARRQAPAEGAPGPSDPQAGSDDSRSEAGRDASSGDVQEESRDESGDDAGQGSTDAQAAQAAAAQQGGDEAEQSGAGGQDLSSAESDATTGSADVSSGHNGVGEPEQAHDSADGDDSEPGAQGTDDAPRESGDSGGDGEAGQDSATGSTAGAGTERGDGQGQAGGTESGLAASGDGDRPAQGSGGDHALDGVGSENDGVQRGEDDSPAGAGDRRDAGRQSGAVDSTGGDEPPEKAAGQEAGSAQEAADSPGDRARAGAEAGTDGDEATSRAEQSGDEGVEGDGQGSGDGAPGRPGTHGPGQAQAEAAAGSDLDGAAGDQAEAPGGAGAGGRDPGPDEGSRQPGDTEPGQSARDGGPGMAEPGRPGLADLLGEGSPSGTAPGRPAAAGDGPDERRQALEQMLRTVEDDPGGLLRQRFLLQHLRRSGQLP